MCSICGTRPIINSPNNFSPDIFVLSQFLRLSYAKSQSHATIHIIEIASKPVFCCCCGCCCCGCYCCCWVIFVARRHCCCCCVNLTTAITLGSLERSNHSKSLCNKWMEMKWTLVIKKKKKKKWSSSFCRSQATNKQNTYTAKLFPTPGYLSIRMIIIEIINRISKWVIKLDRLLTIFIWSMGTYLSVPLYFVIPTNSIQTHQTHCEYEHYDWSFSKIERRNTNCNS